MGRRGLWIAVFELVLSVSVAVFATGALSQGAEVRSFDLDLKLKTNATAIEELLIPVYAGKAVAAQDGHQPRRF